MSSPTIEQAGVLAAFEQVHRKVGPLPEDHRAREQVLELAVTGTRAYICRDCLTILAVEPDGEFDEWGYQPLIGLFGPGDDDA